MAKLPRDPERSKLQQVGSEPQLLKQGMKLWRIYFRAGAHPTQWPDLRYFGPMCNERFDHHIPPARHQDRGITYLAEGGVTCFAECFQDAQTIDIARNEPWLVGFQLVRDVTAHSLRGLWPTRVGGSTAINSGRKDYARNWSRAVYEEYDSVEGLYYSSSMHAGKPAIALYERARDSIPSVPGFHRALEDPDILNLVKNAARALGYRVVDGKDVIWSPHRKKAP